MAARYKKGDKVWVKSTYGGELPGVVAKVHPLNRLGQRYYSISGKAATTHPLTARFLRKRQ